MTFYYFYLFNIVFANQLLQNSDIVYEVHKLI